MTLAATGDSIAGVLEKYPRPGSLALEAASRSSIERSDTRQKAAPTFQNKTPPANSLLFPNLSSLSVASAY